MRGDISSFRFSNISVLQYDEERLAQGAQADPGGNALLDQKGPDLVDRRRPAGDQSRPDAMTRLQVELVLALLLDHAQVWPQRCLRNRFGVVVVVLLTLHEGLGVDRRDDPRLVSQRAQHAADKVRAQTGFHPDDTARQVLECVFENQSPDLPADGDLAVVAQSDEVKNLFADVDTNDRQGHCVEFHRRLHRCFSCSPG
jgi:hypothetical protein